MAYKQKDFFPTSPHSVVSLLNILDFFSGSNFPIHKQHVYLPIHFDF